jgi:hypothetical protein
VLGLCKLFPGLPRPFLHKEGVDCWAIRLSPVMSMYNSVDHSSLPTPFEGFKYLLPPSYGHLWSTMENIQFVRRGYNRPEGFHPKSRAPSPLWPGINRDFHDTVLSSSALAWLPVSLATDCPVDQSGSN